MNPGVHLFVFATGAGVLAYKATPVAGVGDALEYRHERLTPPRLITAEEWEMISGQMDDVMSQTEFT